jgi:uncharacterized protein DUF72
MPKQFIGTAGWTIPRRVADHFPAEGSALVRYAARFSDAEINSTFDRSHQPQTFARWATAVQEDFRFAIKLPKTISYGLRLVGAENLLDTFLEEVRNIGSKIGPLLLQLPPSLKYDHKVAEKFFGFLRKCDGHYKNPDWMAVLVRQYKPHIIAYFVLLLFLPPPLGLQRTSENTHPKPKDQAMVVETSWQVAIIALTGAFAVGLLVGTIWGFVMGRSTKQQ